MVHGFSFRHRVSAIVIPLLLAVITVVPALSRGHRKTTDHSPIAAPMYPPVVAVDPLPEDCDSNCSFHDTCIGNSGEKAALLAMEQTREAEVADYAESGGADSTAAAAVAQREPVRMLHDPYTNFSGVAVDPLHNEVVMTDENRFSIVAYDRLQNTPPQVEFSSPKRTIQGMKSDIEFQSDLYIDPNGDIYAVNNDTLGRMVIFSHGAEGDIAPTRTIETPITTFGIAVDEQHQEIMLTVQNDAAVVTYSKSANGHDTPIRTLQGEHTLMADPHGIALDPKNDLIFVSNWGTVNRKQAPTSGPRLATMNKGNGKENWPLELPSTVPGSGEIRPPSIAVFARDAAGDTAPLRVIQGPSTQLNWPVAMALDPDRGELYVANDPTNTILVFKADASGDAAPIRSLHGPKTLMKNPTGVSVDLKNQELWVANLGDHMATVYPLDASGDTAPLRVIRSAPANEPDPMMGNPHVVTLDTKRNEMLVANCVAHPEISAFPVLADGNAAATRSIAGGNTMITRTIHDMAYNPYRDEIVVPQFYAQSIMTFRGNADGDEKPIRIIHGPDTQLTNPMRLALDPIHNEIFVPLYNEILVFPALAKGNVAPIRILKGPDTLLGASSVAVDPIHNLLIVVGALPVDGKERGEILVFNRTDEGNTKPRAIIGGPQTHLTDANLMYSSMISLYAAKELFLVGVPSKERSSPTNFVGVWSEHDSGDVPPHWTIGGPNGRLRDVRGIALDTKNKSVIVSDKYVNAVMTFYFPEIF